MFPSNPPLPAAKPRIFTIFLDEKDQNVVSHILKTAHYPQAHLKYSFTNPLEDMMQKFAQFTYAQRPDVIVISGKGMTRSHIDSVFHHAGFSYTPTHSPRDPEVAADLVVEALREGLFPLLKNVPIIACVTSEAERAQMKKLGAETCLIANGTGIGHSLLPTINKTLGIGSGMELHR